LNARLAMITPLPPGAWSTRCESYLASARLSCFMAIRRFSERGFLASGPMLVKYAADEPRWSMRWGEALRTSSAPQRRLAAGPRTDENIGTKISDMCDVPRRERHAVDLAMAP